MWKAHPGFCTMIVKQVAASLPDLFKSIQLHQSSFFSHCIVIGFKSFVGYIARGSANLVNDTFLNFGLGIARGDILGEASQIIRECP
ncbi:hypothetical protein [Paenibacillus thalictri]|uniref:hypothetical protein n=1 Tax=Paenibacillus thalictri TaxID=2527873 RepID=UPI0013EEF094|nr:hypothetical protein [Paenibacillus thalictri]